MILYINEFSTQLKAMLSYLFADDTNCLHAATTNDDFIATQEVLKVACKWSKEYSLTFNCSKSAVVHFDVNMRLQLNTYLATIILR